MWRWLLALAGSIAIGHTTNEKLHKMQQIKGTRPGGQVVRTSITQKGIDRAQGRRNYEDSYWITWAKGGSTSWGDRERVEPAVWHSMDVGDPIELVRVPGDNGYYLRNGTYVDPGNFLFDYALLAGSIALGVVSVGALLWRLIWPRRPEPEPPSRGFPVYHSPERLERVLKPGANR
ncbi:MAG: hypothetical protein ACRC8S_04900 [Fimbriiglobus sp.]